MEGYKRIAIEVLTFYYGIRDAQKSGMLSVGGPATSQHRTEIPMLGE
jgi:hypothetical protein